MLGRKKNCFQPGDNSLENLWSYFNFKLCFQIKWEHFFCHFIFISYNTHNNIITHTQNENTEKFNKNISCQSGKKAHCISFISWKKLIFFYFIFFLILLYSLNLTKKLWIQNEIGKHKENQLFSTSNNNRNIFIREWRNRALDDPCKTSGDNFLFFLPQSVSGVCFSFRNLIFFVCKYTRRHTITEKKCEQIFGSELTGWHSTHHSKKILKSCSFVMLNI